MKAVNILGRRDRIDHQIGIQMIRKRQLHQNAMHRRVIVQLIDQRQKIRFGCVRIQLVLKGIHPDFDGLLPLRADVDLTCRVFANKDHRKARRQIVICLEFCHMGRDLFANRGGKSLAVDNLCSHGDIRIQWRYRPLARVCVAHKHLRDIARAFSGVRSVHQSPCAVPAIALPD